MKMSFDPRSCASSRVVVHVLVVARRDRGGHDERARREECRAAAARRRPARLRPRHSSVRLREFGAEARELAAGAAEACRRSACPTGSSGGPGSRHPRPCRRAGAASRARPARRLRPPTTWRSRLPCDASSPWSSRHAACHSVTSMALGVDVGVGGAQRHALERRQRLAELHARSEVYSAVSRSASSATPSWIAASATSAAVADPRCTSAPPPISPTTSPARR